MFDTETNKKRLKERISDSILECLPDMSYNDGSGQPTKVKDDTRLIDLSVESIEICELLLKLEAEFHINIDNTEITLKSTFEEIKDMVFNKIEKLSVAA